MKKKVRIRVLFVIIFALATLLVNINRIKKSARISKPNASQESADHQAIDTFQRIHLTYIHQVDTEIKELHGNFKFFLHFAYAPCDQRIDFYLTLIVNSDELDVYDYIKNLVDDDELYNQLLTCRNTFFRKRLNSPGPDICSYAELLRSDEFKEVKNNYNYFFFINSSVRGPFLPNYWTEPW